MVASTCGEVGPLGGLRRQLCSFGSEAARRAGSGHGHGDATTRIIGAIDWTNKFVMRTEARLAEVWSQRSEKEESGEPGGETLDGGTKERDKGRQDAGSYLEHDRDAIPLHGCGYVVETYHNVHADYITRCTNQEFCPPCRGKGLAGCGGTGSTTASGGGLREVRPVFASVGR